jgi:hypothetical protein
MGKGLFSSIIVVKAKHMKKVSIVSAVWFGVVFMHCLFYHEMDRLLWILNLGVIAYLGLVGFILSFAWAVIAHRNQQRLRGVILCATCLMVTIVFVFTPYGRLEGTYFKFYRNLEHYKAIVAQVSQADMSTLNDRKQNSEYRIDKGPPVRIAFIWGGMLDYWDAIVYDPSGEVMLANSFKRDGVNGKDPQLQGMKKLFGWDLLWTRKLWKHWYFCSFNL